MSDVPRPARAGRFAGMIGGPSPRRGRALARLLVLSMAAGMLNAPAPMAASAAGTVLFDQPFRNNTPNGLGAVVLPALPTGQSGTNVACLTASGNSSTGNLRSCAGSLDLPGSGKLRLTDAATGRVGGLLGAVSVPTSQGLDVTFNTYQYGGSGADGMTFVLAAVDPASSVSPANVGQSGGALGYSAFSSLPGLAYGYLGVGLDVYGNFSNGAYQGSGCTNPAYIGSGSTRVPGQIVIRGPGNGTVGYCAINSTATSTSSTALPLRSAIRTAVPVQVGINPTNTVLTTAAGLTVPANSYRVVVTLVGGAVRTLTGTLPTVPAGLFPVSWLNANGIPRQLAFGWVASTGAITDFHEVDNAKVATISAVPELTIAQTGYNAATLQPGAPVTYSVVAGVAPGLSETSPVSVTQTLPAGTVPVGAYGTGWVCAAPSGRSVTCTNSNAPFLPSQTLPPLTVVGIVTGSGVTPALIQSTTVATASSVDANPAYSTTTTAGTLPAAPGGISLSSTSGTIAGGNTVIVSGTNISNATAIEIGTTAQQAAGTPVVLLPCPSGVTTGCFTINANGTLTIPSMPARASAAAVNVNVVTQGLDAQAAYTYTSAPARPAAPTAVAGVTSATVTWAAPDGNGSPITGYVVTPYIGGVAQTPVAFDASATSRTLTGLTAGTSYTFTVAAVNAVGTSLASPASNAAVPYDVPGRPTITAVTAGTSSANLTWTAPASNGSAITGYVVTPYIGGVAQPAQTFSGTATTRTVTGLTPGTSYTFTVSAVNAAGPGLPSLSSAAVVPNASPAFTFAPPAAGEVNVAYSVPLTVTGGTAPYVWSVSAGSLPPGLTLNASTGVLSGTPTASGSHSFTAQVTDASNVSTTRAVTLVIAPLPVLTFPAPPSGEVNVAYSVPLTVTGGTAPYVWSVSAGSLPPALTLNTSTGVLSGTPTTGGTFSFSVRVVDAFNQSDTRTVSLVIAPLPTFTFNAPPAGQVGVAYSVPLTVSGGVTPYTWSVSAGSLPPGLTLNASTGVLSGTPTASGSYPVTFRVVDANGQADTRTATLVVTAGPLVITKTASTSSVAPGGTIGYTITVNNTGASAFTGVTVSDPLADVLDDAVYNGDAVATGGSVSLTGQTLNWNGNVAAGTTVTITYSVTVRTPDPGDKVLANAVTSPTVGSICPAGGTDPRCSATVTVSGLSIVKTANATTTTPGGTVLFTVTATNTGQTPYAGVTFADPLAGVLDDAVYNGDATATTGVLSFSGSTLTWTGNLAPGASTTVTYSATVRNPDTGDRSLVGTISSGAPGSTCPPGNPGPQCTATVAVLIPALTITSGANVSSTTPGSVVSYTFTASNTGQTPYTGTSFVASLAGVLDDATFNGDLAATSGGAVLNPDGTITWTGNLALGASVTVTGSVTVNNPDAGNRLLSTSITSTAPGGNCPAGNQAPACLTNVPVLVPGLTITKTADVSTTTPGSVVRYTVAVTNSGQTPYTGATFADALAGVLDDAAYNADATATSGTAGFAGSTLTWTGDLAVGATATVTYSVTVNDPDTGDRTLTSTVTSPTTGSNCAVGSGDPRCAGSVTVLVPQLTVTSATPSSTALPGDVVSYTFALANTGQTPYTGISAMLGVTDLFGDVTYNGDLVTSSGSLDVLPDGSLLWTGDVAVGATVTITATVTVNDPYTGDKLLRTSFTSDAPGSTCPTLGATAPTCFTVITVLVPELTLGITADTQTATPGDTVGYTVTVANTGEAPYTGAAVTDLLARVLTDAVYNADATATSGTVVFAGSNLTWTGDLAVGGSATINYSVTVLDPDPGDKRMTSTLVSSAPGSTCPPGGTAPACAVTVTVLVPQLTTVKTANATTTAPGSTVGYTVTVTNSGQTPYTGATFADALGGVLDDAAYNADATATSGAVGFAGSTLTWIGDLAVGASATITYTVTVRDPDPGDALLSDTVVSPTRGSNCPVGNTDPRCAVSVPVARLVLEQSYTQAGATPGSTITLNATFTNTGQVPYTGISVFAASGDTVDDAIPNGDQVAGSGTLVLNATGITWTGNIPVGGVVTVTGTLTLKNPSTGNLVATGTLVSAAPGNNCPSGGTDPRCTATLNVLVPGLTITKTADTVATVQGAPVTYTVTVLNSGQAPYTGATFTDSLAGVLDDATYNGDVTATTGTATFAGSAVGWTGNLAPGASATVTYSVTVNNPDTGDRALSGTISSPTTGSNCAPASGDSRCTSTVIVLVPALTITKAAAPATAVPGSTITYTIVAANTGQLPYTGATFTDALAGVLDDAAYNADATATTGTVGFAGSDVTWTGNLAPGASATITYTVTVDNPVTGDLNLVSTITSATPGGNCPSGGTDPRCRTFVPVTEATTLTFDKVASTTSVAQGEVVTYTVTISNSGLTPYAGATFTDALAGVLDDATYNGDAVAGVGTVTYTEPELTWIGTVPAEGSTTVTYSVTANVPDTGNGILSNTLVSDSVGGNCAEASTDPRCAETVTVASLAIVLTSDKATYLPGEVVRYTTVMTNTGRTPYFGISVLFEGVGGVDDSVPNGDQVATSGSLTLGLDGLTWTGNIPVGGSVTLTGSVTVNNPDLGDKVIPLSVTSAAQGSGCPAAASPGCTLVVTVTVPELTITKVTDRTAVVPGGAVAYTLTIANSGEAPYTDAAVTDSLAGVLNEAAYNEDATATSGMVTFAGQVLTWTGDLAVGASATVTYSVTAGGVSTAGKLLTNAASSTEAGSTCPPASGNVACSTRVIVLTPVLTIVKTADRASITPGGTVAYTITATNSGQVPFGAANLTDALAGVLDDAVYNGDATATRGTVAFAGQAITWSGALNPGQAAVITYSVTSETPGTGDQRLSNAVTSTTPGTICQVGGTDSRCSSEVLISRITITNSADVTTVIPTGTVNYTITIANTGQTPYTGVVARDLLDDVLDDAVYNGDGTATPGDFSVDAGSGEGIWEGSLPVGATATVTFSVTVMNPDPGNKVLRAVAVSATPGTNCPAGSADPACTSTVTVLTPVLNVSKSADRATVNPGGTIIYTITVANTGETPYTGATVTDQLDAVLPDSVYNGDATATSGTVVFTSPDVIWTGDLAIGATATITYSVTVLAPDPGDKSIINEVFSDTLGSTCPSTGAVAQCTTFVAVLVPALRIVNVADTATTTPGGTVGYTITIANTGQTPYTGVIVTDALAGVLDDAVYNGDATATTGAVGFAGSTLTWTGDLAVGASAVVGYSVTVNDPDNGDRVLTGVAVSPAPGSTCPAGGTDPACTSTVTVLIPALAVSTVADRATTTPGGTVRFTITIANTGQTPYTGVIVTDALAGTLDDAVYNGDATATTGAIGLAGSTLTWTGALEPGATAVAGFTVTAGDPGTGDRDMTGVVASAAPGSTCPAGSTAPACSASVTVLIPALNIVKTADAPTTTPGDTVGYTIVVTNAGETPYDAASVTDSLAPLLDEADYNADAVATTGVLDYTGGVLTWTGDLAVGASATITYSVTVHDVGALGDKLLSNIATSGSQGSSCPAVGAATACTAFVSILVPELTITKNAATGTVVAGGTVAYTITAVNTGEADYPRATIADSLAGVLDDAAYNGDAVATVGAVTYTEPTLTWTGDLAVGAAVTITYSVDVAYPGSGNRILTNTAVSSVPGSTCPTGGTDPRCVVTVTVLIPELTITKVADTSGDVVAEETVRYTITVVNTGETPYTVATFADSLAGVLDDAAYNGDAVATAGAVTYTEPTLTWTGDLAVGAAVTITYSVDVAYPGSGNRILTNTAVSSVPGSTCPTGGTDPRCVVTVTVLIPELTITKVADTSGDVVAEETVRYTITVVNTGETPYTVATFADSLAGVLDDAAYNGDAVATAGNVTYTEPTLTWTGDLPVDASAVVTFSVTVDDPDTGDAELDNRVTSTTTGSTCPAGGTDPGCSVVIAVTPTSITLINLTSDFTMAGLPDSTVRNIGAVSMTVITNSFDGYIVTVRADSAELTSNEPGNTATIPVGNLRVRENGTSEFHTISRTTPVLVHEQDVPSSPSGDAIVNDFEADIPFVLVGSYSATLTYVATAK
ncbi:putative Ig domain-containing protein [Streptosporangium sp. G11]|uniref:DUF7927 domain-containing protein n=1 Tax=Streptosporangium sp. G11 TaxID=3436926 RepID=UPI003EBEE6D7